MSRFDNLKKQNPEWDVTVLDLIKKIDPSNTNRYVEFLFKCLKKKLNSPEGILALIDAKIIETLKKFHEYYERGLIDEKDISQYEDWTVLKKNYQEAEEKEKLKEAEKQITILHEDDEWLIMRPESYEAATIYGKGTKWCITQKTHWKDYKTRYFFIYIINKKSKVKYCISKDITTNKHQAWLDNDTSIDILNLEIPYQHFSVIIKELKENKNAVEDTQEHKMWKTANGRIMKIDDMDSVHIRNAIRLFKSRGYLSTLARRQISYMEEVLVRREKDTVRDEQQTTELIDKLIRATKSFAETNGITNDLLEAKEPTNRLQELIIDKIEKNDKATFNLHPFHEISYDLTRDEEEDGDEPEILFF